MSDPFQTFTDRRGDKPRRWVPAPGVRLLREEVGMTGQSTCWSVDTRDFDELAKMGLLVEVLLCEASKVYAPLLTTQGGDNDLLTLTCDKPRKPAHREHHDPNGMTWKT